MTKVNLNPALEAIQGKVGDLIFKRWEGDEIVSKMPNRTGIVPTATQIAQMDKFRLAALDEVLKEGAAVWTPASASWTYTTTTALAQGQAVSIDVSATDRPGHKGAKSQARLKSEVGKWGEANDTCPVSPPRHLPFL